MPVVLSPISFGEVEKGTRLETGAVPAAVSSKAASVFSSSLFRFRNGKTSETRTSQKTCPRLKKLTFGSKVNE